jgi:hypothetical protein
MYFADEPIKEMSAGYAAMRGKLNNLVEAYILREFTNPRAREHASQGFPRRLKVMVRCIDNVLRVQPLRLHRQTLERVPFVTGAHTHRLAECFHLRQAHQPGVIVLVSGHRQAETFDGVADEAGRPVVVGVVKRFEQ